jgi:hypothetical protein
VSANPTPHAVGDQFNYVLTVTNPGNGSASTTLVVNLPSQVTYGGFKVDRGPGCSAAGQVVTCPLDFFPAGLSSTVLIGATANANGTLTLTTSTASSPAETKPSDSAVTFTLTIGAVTPAPTPSPPQPSRTKTTGAASFATLVVIAALKPVSVHGRRPSLRLSIKASKATGLVFTLLDAKGKPAAHWTRHENAGTTTFVLLLPAKALHPGHEKLKITETGNPAPKFVPVTFRV